VRWWQTWVVYQIHPRAPRSAAFHGGSCRLLEAPAGVLGPAQALVLRA